MYDVRLPSKIEVEWCSPETDVTVSPPIDGVYFHPQILALGVKLPLTSFVRDVLARFKVLPSQLHRGSVELFWALKPFMFPLPLTHTGSRNFAPHM